MKVKKSRLGLLPIPVTIIERRIYLIRGYGVMLDTDLAELYQVLTFNLNKAVKRNKNRFLDDFMFKLTKTESESLTFQIGMSKKGRGGRRTFPNAFTEQGIAMLSSVLSSNRAVQVNITIMRAFVKLRSALQTNTELRRKLAIIENGLTRHDIQFRLVFAKIRKLMDFPEKRKKKIGFRTE